MQGCMKYAQADGTEPTPVPYRKPERTWAGYGSGTNCDLCHREIAPHQIEYEVEFAADTALRALHLHRQCFQHWAAED